MTESDALRRRATIVFCDLSGYTALNEALDPEEVEQIMSRIKADAIRIIEGLGGTVNQFVGDEVMALFGIPVAHGDDPVRAVLAALELHASLAPLAADVRAKTGMTIALHTAVNTGLLLARRRDDREGRFTVIGDAVNTCARLLKLAGHDEIVVGAPTERLLGDRFSTEPLEPVMVKGKALPLASFRVLGERPASARFEARPFVGRERELGRLGDLVRELASKGEGATVLLRGEAGIGKSSLAREIVRLADAAGYACHQAGALNFGVARGRDAVATLLGSLVGVDATEPAPQRAAAVDAAVACGLVSAEQRLFVDDLLALTHAPAERAFLEAMADGARLRAKQQAFVEVARRAVESAPMLLVVEDLHWADELVIDALGLLASLTKALPLLLVATTRTEIEATRAERLSVALVGRVDTLDLGPLALTEARALAERILPTKQDVFEDCIARAGGHPLFLVQLLLNADVDEERVPSTVEALVLARMDRLPASEREVLQAASVLGQRFELAALRSLLERTITNEDCASLVAASLLALDGNDPMFTHALVQEAIYGALLLARRRELHRRAADWFHARDRGLSAEHLERAGDPGAALAFLEAARARVDELDVRDAQRLLARGLALAPSAELRHELLLSSARIHLDLGETEASIARYREALDAAERDDQRCRAWLGLAGGMRIADRYAEALKLLELAEAAASANALDHELGRIHHLRGNILFGLGDLGGCSREHGAALEKARKIGSIELEASARGGQGDASYLRGDMTAALACFSQCVELCRANDLVRIEVANSPMLGWLRAYSGEPALALSEGIAAADLAHRVSHQRAEMVGRSLTGWVALEVGDLERASREIERLDAVATALTSHRFMVQALVWSAYLAQAKGDRAEAAERVERAAATRRDSDRVFNGAFTLGALARLGRDRRTREIALNDGERLLKESTAVHNHLWFYRDALECALEWQEWDWVERYADAIETCTLAPLSWSGWVGSRARLLAMVHQGASPAALRSMLPKICDRGRELGYRGSLRAIEAVLDELGPSPR